MNLPVWIDCRRAIVPKQRRSITAGDDGDPHLRLDQGSLGRSF